MLDTPQMAPTTTRCTVPEAAARLGISPETVRRQIRAKRLQDHRGVRDGRSVYLVDVPTADVEPRDTARASIALVDHLQGTAVDLRSRLDSLAHEYREHLARIEDARIREVEAERRIAQALANAHRDEIDRMQSAHAAEISRMEARYADALAATRRRWWHLW